jgi:purine-binding chemotaxis protein CheW
MSRPIVVLRIGSRFFGVDVARARTVIAEPVCTAIPKSPPFLHGVMNLRGAIVPVLCLAKRLGIEGDLGARVCVVDGGGSQVGLLVDDVLEVVEAEEESEVEAWTGAQGVVSSITHVKLNHHSEEPLETFVMILDVLALLELRAVAA